MPTKTKESNSSVKIHFLCTSTEWNNGILRFKRAASKALRETVKMLRIPFNCEITLNLSDDQELCRLNKEYRGKNKPTNVLSFPQYTLKNGNFNIVGTDGKTIKRRIYLGDIAVSYQSVYSESHGQSKNFNDHFTHLVLHGFLHLCGYDHIKENEAKTMETLEIKILKSLGIKNPY